MLAELAASPLDRALTAFLTPPGGPQINFAQPLGEPALCAPDSLSWQVFKVPLALFIGGVAAVILELAEPRVRAGVWDHTSFRSDPVTRLQRTGLAAMVTVYGARSTAEPMIARVGRMHAAIRGVTAEGQAYAADEPELLDWVQATAAFGFLQAYHAFVRPLAAAERSRFYAEGGPAAALYGATGAPASEAELEALFQRMRGALRPSPVILDFLQILQAAPLLPTALGQTQRLQVQAAVHIVPAWAREILGLGPAYGLKPWEAALARRAGALSERVLLPSSPPVHACRRLGLPPDYLYRDRR
jgi:uncharacterized protein (DUF2236 family)